VQWRLYRMTMSAHEATLVQSAGSERCRVEAEDGTPGLGAFFRYELTVEPAPVPGSDDATVVPALASEPIELEFGAVQPMRMRLAPER
jgi:hypothetical protein